MKLTDEQRRHWTVEKAKEVAALKEQLRRKDTEIHDLEVVLAAKIKSYEYLLNADNR